MSVFGQKNLDAAAKPIVAEGKLLYRSEMASWLGTDLFLENYKTPQHIGGYFSYSEGDSAKCIFFSKAEAPQVIGTISFDSSYNTTTAKVDLSVRNFTQNEYSLYQIRKVAFEALNENADEFFKFFQNTNPNIIPLINGQEKKVYVLTGPQQGGVVFFGNDYLLTFDKNNKIASKKQLHKNIIPIEYGKTHKGQLILETMHSHLPETGHFITATDICTLMLYQKIANWKTHMVFSEKYLNIWDCQTNQLTVMPIEVLEKLKKEQEKKDKKKAN